MKLEDLLVQIELEEGVFNKSTRKKEKESYRNKYKEPKPSKKDIILEKIGSKYRLFINHKLISSGIDSVEDVFSLLSREGLFNFKYREL